MLIIVPQTQLGGFTKIRHVNFFAHCLPWTARGSNQSILKEINVEYSLEGLMLKLKFQCFGHLMPRLFGKDPDAGED